MRVNSEAEMLQLGEDFAKSLSLPAVIELVGDVGVGKTTFTRGLALGLGISESVTSPSFTISKRYAFPLTSLDNPSARHHDDSRPSEYCKNYNSSNYGELIHYDFYRLGDPGIMRDELFDTLSQKNAVVVVEWGGDVADLLPESKYRFEISQLNESERELKITHNGEVVTGLWKTCGKTPEDGGKLVDKSSESCVKNVKKDTSSCVKSVDKDSKPCVESVDKTHISSKPHIIKEGEL